MNNWKCDPIEGRAYHAVDELNLSNMSDLKIFPDGLGASESSFRRSFLRVHQAESGVNVGRLLGIGQCRPRRELAQRHK